MIPIPYRYTLIPIALLQLLAAYVPTVLGWGEPIGALAIANGIPPELPPGTFFAIWGPIFLTYLIVAVASWRRDSEQSRQLAGPLALSGILTAAWMVASQVIGHPVLDLVLLVPIVWASWLAAFRFDRLRSQASGALAQTADVLTGLLAGWLTVAVAISVPRAGRYLLNQGPTDSEWISFLSVLAVINAAVFIFKRWISRSWWFFAAAGWGLIGLVVNNWTRTGFGYFGWIVLALGAWILMRRLTLGANGAKRGV